MPSLVCANVKGEEEEEEEESCVAPSVAPLEGKQIATWQQSFAGSHPK